MKQLLLFLLLIPNLALAYEVNVTQGMTVFTINGKPVDSTFSDTFPLAAGKNQISIRFDGKLRNQGKRKHFTSKPYLITFDAQQDVQIKMASSNYKEIASRVKQKVEIFKTDPEAIEQKLLPAISKTFPYANIPALVTHYNDTNGIFFTEKGLERLTNVQIDIQQQSQESMTLSQLKYWFSKATPEEITAFEKWKSAN